MNLEQTLEQEQEFQVNKLIRRIEKLEAETFAKQQILEQVSTLEEGVFVESAFNMRCHIVKNTLLHTAFSVILPAGKVYIFIRMIS